MLTEGVAADPGVHRDRCGGAGVDGAGGAELGYREDGCADLVGLGCQPRTLLTKEQYTGPRQVVGLQRDGAREVVDTDDREFTLGGVPGEIGEGRLVADVLVAV